MNIYIDDTLIDISNISVTDFNEKTQILKEEFAKTEIDFSSIGLLKGEKILLNKAFITVMAENFND
jgi:hypothetical protein